LAIAIASTFARADDAVPLSPSESALVVSEFAVVMAGDKPRGQIPRGTVLEATRARGPWRFIPQLRGWVHQHDLVSVEKAVDYFTQQIQDQPSGAAYHLRGIAWMTQEKWSEARSDLERALELGENVVTLHFNLGVCLERLGLTIEALAVFNSILATYPDEYPASLARGNLLLGLKHYGAAVKDFNQAVKLRPDSTEAFHLQGLALRFLDQYADAIVSYSRVLELDPKHADALANRGYASKRLGKFDAALADYEAAVKLAPEAVEYRNDLAWLLATCPEESIRNPARAVELAVSVCEATHHENGEYLDTLASAYASQGGFAKAVQTAEKALTSIRDNAAAEPVRRRLQLYRQQQFFVEQPL
jgi:tetratricopeptide (TPR) repeat protein